MPSGPTPFDDADGIDPDSVTRSQVDTGEEPAAASGRQRTSPNYRIRRAVVVGGVVAVLATASIVIGRMIGTGATDTSTGAIGAEWNRIVLVDDRTGRVIVDDDAGDELARIDTGVRSPTASRVVDSTLLVTGSSTVAVVDVAAETVDEFDLVADTIIGPAGSALTMIAPRPDDGRALLVHGPSGDVIDTDTFAPVVGARYEFAESRSSASGRDVLVTDSGNFQSVLFAFDREAPSFFEGLALAVDADLVVTAQNVGTDATINLFDHAGDMIATGRTASVRAGMIADSAIVLVTVDGEIVTMSASDGEISQRAQLDIGAIESGDVTTSGDRLVVSGSTGTAIVDGDGEVVTSFDGQRPVGDGAPPTGSACVTTIASDTGDAEDARIDVVQTIDGTVVVEAIGDEPVLSDASGCTIGVATSDGFTVFGPDVVADLDTDDTLVAVSLDGQSIISERAGRLLLLASDGDEASTDDPRDLGPRGRTVHFTQA